MLKLLIVEDEPRTREGLKKCIPWSSFGISQIEEADDGTTALKLIESYKPDIILSDIRMPNMIGIDFVKKVIHELPFCKIIFISGYCDKEYLKAAIQLKAVRYIEKPIHIAELKEAVKTAVDEYWAEQNSRKQHQETASKLESSIELIKQDIAVQLLDQNMDSSKIQSLLSIAGLDMPSEGDYVSVLFRLGLTPDASPESTSELCKKLVHFIRHEFYQEGIPCVIGVKDGVHVIVHVHLKSVLNREKIKHVSEKVMSVFNETRHPETGPCLFAGIGKKVKGLKNLFMSYQTALLAVQKLFFLGNTRAHIYEEVDLNPPQVFNEDIENEFVQYLVNCDKAIFDFIKAKAEQIRKNDATLIDNVKSLFYKLLIALYENAEDKMLAQYMGDRKKEYLWLKVSNALTMNELLDFLLQELKDYFNLIEQLKSKSRAVFEVKQFIRKNYMNSNLTIDDIARELNFAPTYLCKIFKRDTGTTINDYINEFRIEKAKELLADRNIKLYEVASCSGYNDAKYFTKIFKKITGYTPSEFRGKLYQ